MLNEIKSILDSPERLVESISVEMPLRSEILSREGLVEYALTLAEQHRVAASSRGTPALYSRFEENALLLEKAYVTLTQAAQNKEPLTSGAEWLLDNYYIIKEQVVDIRRDLPGGYYRILPKLTAGEYINYPRVYHIALEILAHTDAVLDDENLALFIDAYQSKSVLASSELWAVPIMLRFALIENLRRLVLADLQAKEQRTIAENLVHEIIGADSRSSTDILLFLANKLQERPDFLTSGTVFLMRRLREAGAKSTLTLQWLEERLKEKGNNPEEMARAEYHSQAANQISIGNCVTSLRKMASINWKDWFERVSLVHRTLVSDPVRMYSVCDFITRDSYRHSIEGLSRTLNVSELAIAQQAVALAVAKVSGDLLTLESNPSDTTKRLGHVGYYLVDKGFDDLRERLKAKRSLNYSFSRFLNNHAFVLYIGSISILTLVMVFKLIYFTFSLGATIGESILLALIFGIPLSDLASNVVQWILTNWTHPKPLPKLDLEAGVPDACRTIVTLQVILQDQEDVARVVDGLEVRYLANDDPNILFALLADLKDANKENLPEDLEIIVHAKKLISKLNDRHFPGEEGRFFLFFRRRVWNPSEGKYMALERKRGKIAEFNRFLLGDQNTSLQAHVGNPTRLSSVKYVITLDSDSRLPRGVAKKLIGTMEHPLNRPVLDPNTNIVIDGYAIIQPRVGVALPSAHASRFADIFSGHSGLDPYTQMVSDIYQDLFHEGSYVGKGIYDVRAFEKALHNRVPENSLLSHDLFEGCFARVALATDVEIFDNFPAHYHSYARRLHRWVRGDWQLLPWIFSKIPDAQRRLYDSPISLLGRWKLLDNLRRSLIAPACFIFLILAFTILPGSPLTWIGLVLFVIAFPVYARVANALMLPPLDISVSGYARGVGRDLLKQSFQALLTLSFLPHQAYLMIDAIVVTAYRLVWSRKNLLDWESAYDTERRASSDLPSAFIQMGPGIGLAFVTAILVTFLAPERMIYASPFLLLWAGSPFVVRWLSGQAAAAESKLSSEDREYLYIAGWETWRYFDQLMTAEHNYLPPDNIQLVPRRIIAERTSPTNIGISILSIISAYDMGFIGLPSVLGRLSNTFQTLSKLERFHGHFLNWYQTKTLAPLSPRYISFVDSGNLVGHLIATRSALLQFTDSPLVTERHWLHIRRRLHHFSDPNSGTDAELHNRIGRLSTDLVKPPTSLKDLQSALISIKSFVDFLAPREHSDKHLKVTSLTEFDEFKGDLSQISSIQSMIGWLQVFEEGLPIINQELSSLSIKFKNALKVAQESSPTLSKLNEVCENIETLIDEALSTGKPDSLPESLRPFFTHLLQEIHLSVAIVENLIESKDDLSRQTGAIIEEVELAFLFDSAKGLFSIGYHIDDGRRDNSFYDLLASESRLGSFVAIAMGEVPQKHWFTLGRLLVDSAGGPALVSWSATMFEYLMPLLVMQDFPGTLLSKTYRSVVRTQQIYAQKREVPWGMSESAYSGVDFEKTYQYRAFGIPALGLKRGLADDVVVSPYSTFLALLIDPLAAQKNLIELEKQGMRGEYGFFESIDYTAERLSSDENSHIVQSFLSHHQGMSLIALNNSLHQGIMQQRFHADPWVRATALLLHERFPELVPVVATKHGENQLSEPEQEIVRASKSERFTTPHTRYPRTSILSNGHYTIMVDNAGNGFSIFDRDTALTRWREDGIAGQYGTYIFIRDLDDGKLWSVAYQPTRVEPEAYEVLFNPDKIEFKRRDFGIALHTEITVSPEDNIELRQVTITNISNRRRNLEVTSYAEVALAHNRADLIHPVFSKMFIETEYNHDFDGIICSRRPRSKDEERLYLMHMLTMKTVWQPTQYESSRVQFLGRGNRIGSPAIFDSFNDLTNTTGKVLDPIFSLRARIELDEGQSECAVFATAFAKSREELVLLGQRYHDSHSITRAFEMAWSHSNIEIRNEQFSIRQIHSFQRLATAVLYNIDPLRGNKEALLRNKLTQAALWRFGVPGDLPIVLLRIDNPTQIILVQELLAAHQYIRMRGIGFDLVIVNEYPGGYLQTFQEELEFMVRAGYSISLADKKGGIYLRSRSQVSPDEIGLLETVARAVIWGVKGSLASQLRYDDKPKDAASRKRIPFNFVRTVEYPAINLPKAKYEFFNGTGGFIDQGSKYQLELSQGALPPLPWSNVVANPNFGFLVTESGGGYTWSQNSRENKLTPWSNDPVSDASGEVIYLRDIDKGFVWTPTPRPIKPSEKCLVRHSFGHSQFILGEYGIESQLTISGSTTDNVKWWQLKLTNHSEEERRLEVYIYIEWTLGVLREESSRYLVTDFDQSSNILHATNSYNNEFAGRVVSIGSNLKISSFTTSRHDFIGQHRGIARPRQFEAASPSAISSLLLGPPAPIELSKKVGAGFDSCGVLKVEVNLAPGQSRDVLFFLNESGSIDEAKKLASRHRSLSTRSSELEKVTAEWNSVLSTVQIRTPDRAFDILMNGWLAYQTLSCRIYGRSAFYQSGGAIGFRDQLQDSLSLLYSRSDLTRAQILIHAARQFLEGDVQHWWHPPTGRGVRTRISDDYLWLPFVVSRYLEFTNDLSILDELAPFIEGPKLEVHQMESYTFPQVSRQTASVYDHCVLALDRALVFGSHGLPLMGGGDWNDGMNEVGKEGRGESVWLAWFLSFTLKKFAHVSREKNDISRASNYETKADLLDDSVNDQAWDGEWYRRAYFDDGTPLGSNINAECKIDSLAQSWSVIAESKNIDRRASAMNALRRELVRPKDKLICLLDPPFDNSVLEPGYIKGYLPGTRENGGQYTHAAAWVVMATALQGKGKEAFDLFSMLNPINHTLDASGALKYQGEPYVVAGDVYSVSPHVGRAGWSWYTGSASWLYQVGLEYLLGLKVRGDYFLIDPVVPPDWKSFSIIYLARNVRYHIEVLNPDGVERGIRSLDVDGQNIPEKRVHFVKATSPTERLVRVQVTMGL